MLTTRIIAAMAQEGLELRIIPQRAKTSGSRNYYEEIWFVAAIYFTFSGQWVWTDGEGTTPEAAVADLLQNQGDEIEAYCKELEERGYTLPPLEPTACCADPRVLGGRCDNCGEWIESGSDLPQGDNEG